MTEPSPEAGSDAADASSEGTREATLPRAKSRKAEKPRKADKKPLPVWQESLLLLAIALVLAIGIKFLFVQAFYIPSPSMEPQFVKNDRILVQKVSYWGGGDPQRGDIIVFKDPGGWLDAAEGRTATNPFTKALEAIGLYPSGGHLVKRVIGVGGDRVVCCDSQGRVTVNGKALDEDAYLPFLPGSKTEHVAPSEDTFDIRVKPGYLWVMGDNRGNSCDSRCHLGQPGAGQVSTKLVVGKVWALIWPWKRAERIHTPATFKNIPAP